MSSYARRLSSLIVFLLLFIHQGFGQVAPESHSDVAARVGPAPETLGHTAQSVGPAPETLGHTPETLAHAPASTPESLGFSSERLARIGRHLDRQVADEILPGAVALVMRHGRPVYLESFGMMDRESATPMRVDAVFRIASMTKPITSAAVMILYEEGHFLLNDPVSRYLPEFSSPRVLVAFNPVDSSYTTEPARREITIRDLLTHTSGIGYGLFHERVGPIYRKADVPDAWDTRNVTTGEKMRVLAELPLAHHPGEAFTYGLNTDVLGYLVEVVSGTTLDRFLAERLFAPLGMVDTYFYLPDAKSTRLAALYTRPEAGGLERYGQALMTRNGWHASPDYPIEGARSYFSGGGGLVSTAADYARFLQMLLDGGELDGTRILSPKSVELMTVDHVGHRDGSTSFGLGFSVRQEIGLSGEIGSKGTYDWGGYWGTTFWVDPQEELIAVFLSQVSPSAYDAGRFRVLVYQAITESLARREAVR